MARKIIIDTDPGVDDAMAIFYALESPELDVIGLTTIFGNATTDICTTNALRLLEIADRTDIPVAAGSPRPLASTYRGHTGLVHGLDGQGNTNLPAPRINCTANCAAEFIVEQVMSAPGEVTIVALAPLTNVALALLLQPNLAANIRELVLMGGNAFVPGNATPAAEANIYNDPEAADLVFGMDCPITMVGLDITRKMLMRDSVLETLAGIPNARAQHLARIIPHYQNFYNTFYNIGGIYVHDSTTISYLLAPEKFTSLTEYAVRVETMGISRGKTWPGIGRSGNEREVAWQGRPRVNILVDADVDHVLQMELDRLAQT